MLRHKPDYVLRVTGPDVSICYVKRWYLRRVWKYECEKAARIFQQVKAVRWRVSIDERGVESWIVREEALQGLFERRGFIEKCALSLSGWEGISERSLWEARFVKGLQRGFCEELNMTVPADSLIYDSTFRCLTESGDVYLLLREYHHALCTGTADSRKPKGLLCKLRLIIWCVEWVREKRMASVENSSKYV